MGESYRRNAIMMAPSLTGLRNISEIGAFKSFAKAEKFIISRAKASSKNGLDTNISCTQEAIVFNLFII